MKRKRIHNDIKVTWVFLQDGLPYMIDQEKSKVYLHSPFGKSEISDFVVSENVIEWTFYGKDQKLPGKYSLTLSVNEGEEGMLTIDKCNFVELVSCSCKEGGSDECNVRTESIELVSTISLCGGGGGSYDDTKIKQDIADLQEKDKATDAELAELSAEIGKKVDTDKVATINGQSLVQGGNITIEGGGNSVIATGTFAEAQEKANSNDGIWMWLLNDEIKKPIWHIGGGNFVDAAGARIELEPESAFRYTVVLIQDNDTIVVPTVLGKIYNMVVDWGDGSAEQSVSGIISRKTLTHTYSGVAGTKYQITLRGVVPGLLFGGDDTYSVPAQLHSIDENTIQNTMVLGFDGVSANFGNCINLVSVSANAIHNAETKTRVSFNRCSSLKSLPVGLLDGFELTTLESFVGGCSVLELSEDFMNNLAQKISGVTSFYYAFNGCKGKIHIPDNFFDNVVGGVTDVRQMTANATGVTGDAKKLYDSLKTKMTSENVEACFAGTNLSNRDQVPTSWGGTLK